LTSSVVQLTPGDKFHLKSENFPRNYLRGRSCWMFITTGSSHFIKLTFSYFNLDTTYDDYLKVKFLLIWWKRECRRRKCLRGNQCKVFVQDIKNCGS